MTCQAENDCLFGNHNKDGVTCFCPTDEKERNFKREVWGKECQKWTQGIYDVIKKRLVGVLQ